MAYQGYPPHQPTGYYPPPQQSQQPPPMSYGQSDPFRAYYADRLRQLTFNSRPIIQDLSVIALEKRNEGNFPAMRGIVEEIENALLRAPSQGKLPLLYLLDSISKNVGQPYTDHLLPPVLPRMYVAAYRQVDGVTRAKLEEMIHTWRNGGQYGAEVYPPGLRETVERDVIGLNSSFPTRDQVLHTLDQTLTGKQREAAGRPWDQNIPHQIQILGQIGSLLSTSQPSAQDLQDIMTQLKSMAPVQPPTAPPLSGPPPISQPPPAFQPPAPIYGQPPRQPYSGLSSVRPPQNLPPFGGSLSRDPSNGPSMPPMPSYSGYPPQGPPPTHPIPQIVTPSSQYSTPPPPATVTPVSMPADIAQLLKNINSGSLAGLLGNPKTPDGGATALPKVKSRLESYEDLVVHMDIRLENLDLNTVKEPTSVPVSHLPQRCVQCGIRFPESEGVMQAHLDWHFRRNRRERESEGRGAHRRWLPRAEEWIQDFVNAEAGPSNPSASKAAIGQLSAERISALKKRHVKVPSDPALAAIPCPICKEKFKSEWSEEHEEWVWWNAVAINDKKSSPPEYYHAVCRAEQMSAKAAARLLRDPTGARSSKSPRLTPGLEGIKAEITPATSAGSTASKLAPSRFNDPHPTENPATPAEAMVKDETMAEVISTVPQLSNGQDSSPAEPSSDPLAAVAVEEAAAHPLNSSTKRKAEDEDGDFKRVKVESEESVTSAPVETNLSGSTAVDEPSNAAVNDIEQLAESDSLHLPHSNLNSLLSTDVDDVSQEPKDGNLETILVQDLSRVDTEKNAVEAPLSLPTGSNGNLDDIGRAQTPASESAVEGLTDMSESQQRESDLTAGAEKMEEAMKPESEAARAET